MNSENFYIMVKGNYLNIKISKSKEVDSLEGVIVFIHGLSSMKSEKDFLFSFLAKRLAQNLNVLTVQFDLRGHGDSTGIVSECTLNDWIHDVIEVMNYISINYKVNRVHFIASGIGNIIAHRIMRETPERVISCSLLSPSDNYQELAKLLQKNKDDVVLVEDYIKCKYVKSNTIWEIEPVFTEETFRLGLIKLGCHDFESIGLELKQSLLLELSKYNFIDELSSSQTQVKVIKGEHCNWGQNLSENLKVNLALVPGASHFLHEKPIYQEYVFNVLYDYISSKVEM